MLSRFAGFLTALSLFASATPYAAVADAPPVVVKSCDIDRYRMSLDLTFVNASSKTITRVQLALTSGDEVLAMKDDAGTFAAGDVVSHRLRVESPYFELWGKVGCSAARVTFQDGTTWDNPSISPDMSADVSQTPGSNVTFTKCFTSDQVYMDFTNTAAQDIASIDLGLLQRGVLVWTVTEKGPFSKGTVLHKSWDLLGTRGDRNQTERGMAIDSDMLQNRCTVLSITYADGTSWQNPSTPPASPTAIPFDPPSPAPDAPLTVTGCNGSSTSYYGAGDWRVDYQNTSQKPSIAADFALVMHGHLIATARDVHNLSPGDGTRGTFPLGDPNFIHPVCIPIRMDFADGTEWVNPLFAPPSK